MQEIISTLANNLKIANKQILTTLNLLKEGATIPFIARYRKQLTNGLDEEQIATIAQEFTYLKTLSERKETILKILREKEVLNSSLETAILNANTKSKLEQIYEPFKTGRISKASKAIAAGLEPLAKEIFSNKDPNFDPYQEAKKFLTADLKTVSEVIAEIQLIIAEWMNQNVETRQMIYRYFKNRGLVTSRYNKKIKAEEEPKFSNYHNFEEAIIKIPNHRILALNRGEKLKILKVDLIIKSDWINRNLYQYFFKNEKSVKIILASVDDSLKRLILPSIKRQIWAELLLRANDDAIELFANNLEAMLLLPALKNKKIMAIDPGFISGCKIAILGSQGQVLELGIINPHLSYQEQEKSAKVIIDLIKKYQIDLIAIGNGTASRETEIFIKKVLTIHELKITTHLVSEVGASVYSASKLAIAEFPNLSVEKRSAIHIGRKFQDPLNELVKIDPRAIGIGQYQHDVDQRKLKSALSFKVNKVVHQVGVDLNSATSAILNYISGLNSKIITNIIKFRTKMGGFKTREQLLEIAGFGPKSYQLAIGFLRINNSPIFYDKTSIHPELYPLADQIKKHLKLDFKKLNHDILKQVSIANLAKEIKSNYYDVELIINAFKAPNKDIRDDKKGFLFTSKITNFNEVKVDMILLGEVQNITNFGIFIYVGLKEAVFVHISKMASRFVKHPSEIVALHQPVKIKVIAINENLKQIKGELISEQN